MGVCFLFLRVRGAAETKRPSGCRPRPSQHPYTLTPPPPPVSTFPFPIPHALRYVTHQVSCKGPHNLLIVFYLHFMPKIVTGLGYWCGVAARYS